MSTTLQRLLSPRSVAVIGASNDPTKRGYQAIRTLLADGFPGAIYPIHPRATEILGLQAHRTVLDVEGDVDLALVCTPAGTVPDVLRQCGTKQVSGAVILAGGFSESGDAGRRLEQEALEVARAHGIRLVGPNTSGIFNLHARLNLVGFSNVEPGGLGIVSQSGNVALALVTEGQVNGHVGFSAYIGVGNQADLEFSDYLEYLGEDEPTKVPVLYVEGFKDGRRFLDVARRVTQRKPVVVYKSGRSAAGRRAARSHTGALAGSYEMTVGVLEQAGVTVVRQSDDILPVAEAMSLLPLPPSSGVAVLADGGGHATIATDALIEAGLALVPLRGETRRALSTLLPPAASLDNPVDVAGGTDANPGVFADCARVLLADPAVGALLIVGLFGGYGLRFAESLAPVEEETADRLAALVQQVGKPIVLQSLYAPLKTAALARLRSRGVPTYGSIETAVSCLAAVVHYARATRRNAMRADAGATPGAQPAARAILDRSRTAGRHSLLEHEARALLRAYGIDVPPDALVRTSDELQGVAVDFGDRPLVMKIVSKDILHKSDVCGVRLDLVGEPALRAAFDDIVRSARACVPDAEIEGVLVCPEARKGVEVIIGVSRDPAFGPVMMFGLGGTFVEVLGDVVFRTLPLSEADVEDMLDELKAKDVLAGARGAKPVGRRALVDLMLKISTVALAHPEIVEIDLNPVIAYGDECVVVDARMITA